VNEIVSVLAEMDCKATYSKPTL